MSRIKSGDRVGAMTHSDEQTVFFLGYGVYEGDFEPPDDLVLFGATWGEVKAINQQVYQEMGIPYEPDTNPRIQLDNGDTVWGCECWWGPEDEVQQNLASVVERGKQVVEVRIADYRQQGAELIASTSHPDLGMGSGDVPQ